MEGMVYTDVNYNEEFICNLLKEIEDKIALVSDKDYKNQVYILGLSSNISNYSSLVDMSNILKKIISCNSCYDCFEIENIVSVAKGLLNKC